MNTNNTDKAVKWFMELPFDERIAIANKFYPEYAEDNTDLEDAEIEYIYLSEHPQSKDTVPVQVEGFTGGEWEAKYNTELFPNQAAIYGDYGDENGRVIAVMDTSDETDMANIDLVCAAPAMYAALKELIEQCQWIPKEVFTEHGKNGFQGTLHKAAAILNRIDNK